MKFHKDMRIQEALQLHPEARNVFIDNGMECISCMGMDLESIEDGAKMHHINLNKLLEELNKLISEDEELVQSSE